MLNERIILCYFSALVAFFVLFLSTNGIAEFNINGMDFNEIPINVTSSTPGPSDYLCTKSGSIVTFAGQQPDGVSNVTYFAQNYSTGNEQEFSVSIDLTTYTGANSIAGIMYMQGHFLLLIMPVSGIDWVLREIGK